MYRVTLVHLSFMDKERGSVPEEKCNNTIASSTLTVKISSTPYDSPCLVSPASSSAFVSALQSPYISPRATAENSQNPSDIASSSYTPPSDPYEFSDDTSDTKLKYAACIADNDTFPPRISFSFPVPRISFAKSSFSAAKLTTCDVYIGFHGHDTNLVRFCKWLRSELELHGIDCFAGDRAKYSDSQSHEIADRVICSVAFGLVVVTPSTFLNHFSMEEIRFFVQKKNLIPLFFETFPSEIMALADCNSVSKECLEAMDGVMKCHELKLEATDGNWSSCIMKAVGNIIARLGRKREGFEKNQGFESFPFPRNTLFVGREKEIMEIEGLFFGNGNCAGEHDHCAAIIKGEASGQSEGLADEESDNVDSRGRRFISLEMDHKSKDSTLESWVDVEPTKGKNSFKRKKHKKSRSGNYKSFSSTVICINGAAGMGKSDLAVEFAYRYYQRYKMVLWVGGEARYLRQNILNLSLHLGVNVGADSEVERGRIRSFEEQENEAFKRIKREVFSDMPYLLIIDNLESEEDWWEGKNMHDLIPINTGGTHVIITSRLSKVMNYDMIQLHPLPISDAMVLIRGRKKKEYSSDEVEFLKKFYQKLGRLTFGICVIGSLLSELGMAPSALFEEIDQIQPAEYSPSCYMSISEEQLLKNNPFLLKTLEFCFRILDKSRRKQSLLAKRMLLVSGWFAPSPISASLLASAANNIIPRTKTLDVSFNCLPSKACKNIEDSAMLLVKLGMARIASEHEECCIIHFHPIMQAFAKNIGGLQSARAVVQGVTRKTNDPRVINSDHFWASAFLVFGFKSEPPSAQLEATDMVLYIKRTALPLAIHAFSAFSRCNSALDLLKVCTDALEEAEKSFVSQIQDWSYNDSICWKRRLQRGHKVDEYVWQEVTLLKATLLETRAKLLARGGLIDSGKEMCRTCISIRTVMLGHNHAHTLAAQDTLARLVRMRSKT